MEFHGEIHGYFEILKLQINLCYSVSSVVNKEFYGIAL
jgi:hypothetical protein